MDTVVSPIKVCILAGQGHLLPRAFCLGPLDEVSHGILGDGGLADSRVMSQTVYLFELDL